MNDEQYERLSTITDRLLKFCDRLNQKRDFATASILIPITSDLTVLLSVIGQTNGKRSHLKLVRR